MESAVDRRWTGSADPLIFINAGVKFLKSGLMGVEWDFPCILLYSIIMNGPGFLKGKLDRVLRLKASFERFQ